jgi:hypothetical protein
VHGHRPSRPDNTIGQLDFRILGQSTGSGKRARTRVLVQVWRGLRRAAGGVDVGALDGRQVGPSPRRAEPIGRHVGRGDAGVR